MERHSEQASPVWKVDCQAADQVGLPHLASLHVMRAIMGKLGSNNSPLKSHSLATVREQQPLICADA
jgi:hypothetical protein